MAGVRLTHPDRVLYPEQGLTKRHLALFYEHITDWILPHIAERPLSLFRCLRRDPWEGYFSARQAIPRTFARAFEAEVASRGGQ